MHNYESEQNDQIRSSFGMHLRMVWKTAKFSEQLFVIISMRLNLRTKIDRSKAIMAKVVSGEIGVFYCVGKLSYCTSNNNRNNNKTSLVEREIYSLSTGIAGQEDCLLDSFCDLDAQRSKSTWCERTVITLRTKNNVVVFLFHSLSFSR